MNYLGPVVLNPNSRRTSNLTDEKGKSLKISHNYYHFVKLFLWCFVVEYFTNETVRISRVICKCIVKSVLTIKLSYLLVQKMV